MAQIEVGSNQIFVLDITRFFDLVATEQYTVTLRWSRSGGPGAGIDSVIYNAQLAVFEVIGS